MYDRILLPTDGNNNAQIAAKRAIRTAEREDAALHVLYVVEKSQDDPTQKGRDEHIAEQLNEGRDVVDEIVGQAKNEGVDTTSTVEDGVVRTMIEKYADEHEIDLITIGSTGASGATEKLLGTVSKYVVNEAPADVLVVRSDEQLS